MPECVRVQFSYDVVLTRELTVIARHRWPCSPDKAMFRRFCACYRLSALFPRSYRPGRRSRLSEEPFLPCFSSLIIKRESKYVRVRKIGLTLRDLQQCFSTRGLDGSRTAGKKPLNANQMQRVGYNLDRHRKCISNCLS